MSGPEKKIVKEQSWLDALGVGASSLCLVHCLATPLILALLPAVELKFLGNSTVHQTLAFFVVFFCLSAIVTRYMKHRDIYVLLLMSFGLAIVLFATYFATAMFGDNWEVPLITIGNAFVISGHLRNRRMPCCDHEEEKAKCADEHTHGELLSSNKSQGLHAQHVIVPRPQPQQMQATHQHTHLAPRETTHNGEQD